MKVCVVDQRFITKEVCQPLHVYVRRNIFTPQVTNDVVTIFDYHPGEIAVAVVRAFDGDGVCITDGLLIPLVYVNYINMVCHGSQYFNF